MLRAIRPYVHRLGARLCSSNSEEIPAELKPRREATIHTAYHQKAMGRVYDNKPRQFKLQKGKQYFWCACGWSHNQPFCDGTHKNPHYKIQMKPLRIVPEETKEYWLCNCKQSSFRPFCDGTHKTEAVQSAIKVYKNNF